MALLAARPVRPATDGGAALSPPREDPSRRQALPRRGRRPFPGAEGAGPPFLIGPPVGRLPVRPLLAPLGGAAVPPVGVGARVVPRVPHRVGRRRGSFPVVVQRGVHRRPELVHKPRWESTAVKAQRAAPRALGRQQRRARLAAKVLLRGAAPSISPGQFPSCLSVPKARQARTLSQSCLASPGAFCSSTRWPLRTAAVVASSAGSTTATRSFADEAHPCAAPRWHGSSRSRRRRAARRAHLGARSRMCSARTFASSRSRLLVAVRAAEAVGVQDLVREALIRRHTHAEPRPPRAPARRARALLAGSRRAHERCKGSRWPRPGTGVAHGRFPRAPCQRSASPPFGRPLGCWRF